MEKVKTTKKSGSWAKVPARDRRDVIGLLNGYVNAAKSLEMVEHLQPGVARMAEAYRLAVVVLKAAVRRKR